MSTSGPSGRIDRPAGCPYRHPWPPRPPLPPLPPRTAPLCWPFLTGRQLLCPALQRNLNLCIPRKGITRPQSQFPHSCVCEPRSSFPVNICFKFSVLCMSLQCAELQTAGQIAIAGVVTGFGAAGEALARFSLHLLLAPPLDGENPGIISMSMDILRRIHIFFKGLFARNFPASNEGWTLEEIYQ